MKRVPKAPPKENQINQQRNTSEAERKFRVHFTNYVEELTSLKRSKQSKRQSGNPNTISREELQRNATQAMNDSETNNNYPTDSPAAQTVQNGATASGQETENVSETSSAKQRRE